MLLSYFTKGSPSCLRIARAVAYHVLIGSKISPVSSTQLSYRVSLIFFKGELRPSPTRPISRRAVQPGRTVQYHGLNGLRCAHFACRRTGRRFIWHRQLRCGRKHVKEAGACAGGKPT
jgi:hypothetical protein